MGSANSQQDGIVTPGDYSADWDGIWYSQTSVEGDYWYSEIHIPWTVAPMTNSADGRKNIGLWFSRVVFDESLRFAFPNAYYSRTTFMEDWQPLEVDQVTSSTMDWFPYISYASDLYDGAAANSNNDFNGGLDFVWRPNSNTQLTGAINPDFGQLESIEDNDRLTIALQKVYKTAYHHYNNGAYKQSMSLIDSALSPEMENAFVDYLLLLRAICFGKTDGIYKYQFELNNFIEDQPTSELIEYAKELITVSEAFQINLFSASKAKYITNTDREHYFLYLYPSDIDLETSVSSLLDDYLSVQNSKLITGNMVFDKTYSIAMVTPFSNLETAQKFRSEIEANLLTSAEKEKWINLIMTKENFDIFYKTKDLDSYLTFFDKYY